MLFSVGPQGNGGYSKDGGGLYKTCRAAPSIDQQNCKLASNTSATFIDDKDHYIADGTQDFDDYAADSAGVVRDNSTICAATLMFCVPTSTCSRP